MCRVEKLLWHRTQKVCVRDDKISKFAHLHYHAFYNGAIITITRPWLWLQPLGDFLGTTDVVLPVWVSVNLEWLTVKCLADVQRSRIELRRWLFTVNVHAKSGASHSQPSFGLKPNWRSSVVSVKRCPTVSIYQFKISKHFEYDIANRSRVSCAHNTSSRGTSAVTRSAWNLALRSLKIIQTGTIRKLGYGCLFSGRIFSRLWDIQRQKNGVTLKTRLGVVQGHWKWRRSIDHIRLLVGHCNYSSMIYLVQFFYLFNVE